MIVVSVLLILVAVTLLVLGVAIGSSTLLISSIVASLLAAIALVAGARQTAAMRRAAAPVPEPLQPDIDAGPGPDLPVAEPVGAGVPDAAAAAESGPARAGRIPGGRRWRRDDATPEPSFADNPPASDEGLASPMDTKPRVANREDAEAALAADAAYRASAEPAAAGAAYRADADPAAAYRDDAEPAAPDATHRDDAEPIAPDVDDLPVTGQPERDGDPDYQRASSVTGSRSDDPDQNAGRRPADESGLADEFGEPDPDDPDDEPLPQAVRPGDAVSVARMSAEVLVVDGRPRYHLAACPHLVGRLTEPLPVAEAVELGFSPCGLCRPVDRLVARAAQF
jgi:clumping factor A